MYDNTKTEIFKNALSNGFTVVSGIVQTIVSTLFLNKTSESSELKKLKQNRLTEVLDELLDNKNITHVEYYKCNNFLKIAELADEYLSTNDNNTKENEYDFDWFIKFYDYSSNVSKDDLQKIWAHILAQEVINPDTISITLLNSLSLMRKKDIDFFCNISRFVFDDVTYNCYHPLIFISTNREAYRNSNITPSKLKDLERFGLIECDFYKEYIFKNRKIFRKGNHQIDVYGDSQHENVIKSGNVKFTKDGELLYLSIDAISKVYRNDISEFTFLKFKNRNCKVLLDGKEI